MFNRRGDRENTVDRLVKLTQQLMASFAMEDVGRLAVTETLLLSGADGGALLSVDPTGLTLVFDSGNTVDAALLPESSLLTRAEQTSTGGPVTDPALVSSPTHVLAIPIVHEQKITDVMICTKKELAFTGADLEAIEQILPVVSSSLLAARRHAALEESGSTDALTNVYNRGRLESDITEPFESTEHGRRRAFLMIDIDHFKEVNDTYGHAAGDEVLKQVASALAHAVRADDSVYRYGGEEFVVTLSDIKLEEAMAASERIRLSVQSLKLQDQLVNNTITVSIGLAMDFGDAEQAIADADAAMYQAKREGRNQVKVSF